MAKLERVLPTFIFVVMLGSNLLNMQRSTLPVSYTHLTLPTTERV